MDSPYAELVVMFAGAVLAIVGILNSTRRAHLKVRPRIGVGRSYLGTSETRSAFLESFRSY
jgi:hypothetical protein